MKKKKGTKKDSLKEMLKKGLLKCFICGKPAEVLLDNFDVICSDCLYKHRD